MKEGGKLGRGIDQKGGPDPGRELAGEVGAGWGTPPDRYRVRLGRCDHRRYCVFRRFAPALHRSSGCDTRLVEGLRLGPTGDHHCPRRGEPHLWCLWARLGVRQCGGGHARGGGYCHRIHNAVRWDDFLSGDQWRGGAGAGDGAGCRGDAHLGWDGRCSVPIPVVLVQTSLQCIATGDHPGRRYRPGCRRPGSSRTAG